MGGLSLERLCVLGEDIPVKPRTKKGMGSMFSVGYTGTVLGFGFGTVKADEIPILD